MPTKTRSFSTNKRISQWLEENVFDDGTQFTVVNKPRKLSVIHVDFIYGNDPQAGTLAKIPQLITWELEFRYARGLWAIDEPMMEQLPALIKHKCYPGTKWFRCKCGSKHDTLETKFGQPRALSMRGYNTSKMKYYECLNCGTEYFWTYKPFKSFLPQKRG